MATIELNLKTLLTNKANIKSVMEALIGSSIGDDMSTWSTTLNNYRTNIMRFFWNNNTVNLYIPPSFTTTAIRAHVFLLSRLLSITFAPNQNITSIAESAFDNAYNLEKIGLPTVGFQNVTTIGKQAFYYCLKLGFFDFGDKLTSIGNSAFSSTARNTPDRKLVVIFRATTPPTLGTTAFTPANLSGGLYIYVPDESVDAYKTATNWSTFASYIYPLSEYLES